MQMTRNWQESFDKLEQSRRDEQRMREEEERQIRLAEAAYAQASLEGVSSDKPTMAESASFMLIEGLAEGLADQAPEPAELPVEAEPAAKPKSAKSGTGKKAEVKSATRKPAAPRRTARAAKPGTARPPTAKRKVTRPKAARLAKPEAATPPQVESPPKAESHLPELIIAAQPAASPPAISLPRETSPTAAEPLLITPLPRSASLARYNKRGLFGLIGSWLRLAARRPRLPESLRRPSRKDQAPRDDLASLREENRQLRRELEALRARRANSPPWESTPETTPAGDVPARPRRRGGILP